MHKGDIIHVPLRSNLDAFEQLVDLFFGEFLPEGSEDVFEFALTDEAVAVFVEDLEAADEFVYMGGVEGEGRRESVMMEGEG
jgi:hypothetical protein